MDDQSDKSRRSARPMREHSTGRDRFMSAQGHQRTSAGSTETSAFPSRNGHDQQAGHVHFVPTAEVGGPHSITSSARASNVSGKSRPSDFAVLRLRTRLPATYLPSRQPPGAQACQNAQNGATKFRENRQKAQ
jgi:hypothetical protein